MEQAIKWFSDRLGRVTYSMTSRNGPNSFDCSSAVYHSLISAGIMPQGTWVGNTESMFRDLPKYGFERLQPMPGTTNVFDVKRGDIFIWGRQGASAGALGHTGILLNGNDMIHCNYGSNGITINNYNYIWQLNGSPAEAWYRYTGKPQTIPSIPAPNNPVDQILGVGSRVKITGEFTVNDLKFHNGVWQVRINKLAPVEFTWDDNGVPAAIVQEIEKGYATKDQVLAKGSSIIIPGYQIVTQLAKHGNTWWAKLRGSDGLEFWTIAEPLTEIADNDNGIPKKGLKPETPKEEPKPPKEEDKPEEPKPVEPVEPEITSPDEPEEVKPTPTPIEPETPSEDEETANNDNKKETDMSVIENDMKIKVTEQITENENRMVNVNDIKPLGTTTMLILVSIADLILAVSASLLAYEASNGSLPIALGVLGGSILTALGYYRKGKKD